MNIIENTSFLLLNMSNKDNNFVSFAFEDGTCNIHLKKKLFYDLWGRCQIDVALHINTTITRLQASLVEEIYNLLVVNCL